jgi:molybdopterin molybdotransferase
LNVSVHLTVPADFCYPPGTISVDQAMEFMLARARAPSSERALALDDALGGVMARTLGSPIDVPGYANSQMDGYAVCADTVDREGSWLVVSQRIVAGMSPPALRAGTAARIFTGAPIPDGADTVVMQERCELDGERVWIPAPSARGDNVRPRGNDIEVGQQVLHVGQRLRAQHLGLAASVGIATLPVFSSLRVAFFSSGDELRFPGQPLQPGQIYNSNRFILRALIERLGCIAIDLGRVEDTLDATKRILRQASEQADVVVSSGGVSVGDEDHVKNALQDVGELDMWRIAVKPGKPLAYGRIGEADFIGLPGNPVSTLVTFCLFVRPFLLTRMGVRAVQPRFMPVRAGFDWPRAAQRREFARARISGDDRQMPVASLHPKQGSDVLSSTSWADGLVEIPEGSTVAVGDVLRYLDFDHLMS